MGTNIIILLENPLQPARGKQVQMGQDHADIMFEAFQVGNQHVLELRMLFRRYDIGTTAFVSNQCQGQV